MEAEDIIDDIIWAYKALLNPDKFKEMFKPIMETWALKGNEKPNIALLDLSSFRIKRKRKKLTLRDVEKATGISNAYLSQLETGKIKKPSFEVVQKLTNLYL